MPSKRFCITPTDPAVKFEDTGEITVWFDTLDELKEIPWVKAELEHPMFHRLSVTQSARRPSKYLVVELDQNRSYKVIGMIRQDPAPLRLPTWCPPERMG